MRVLAFEAAHAGCSVALHGGASILSQRSSQGRGRVVEDLVPLTFQVLADAGFKPADLDAVAVLIGPGGFTGVRAGVAAARAWALGAGLPVSGLDTLQVAAIGAILQGQPTPILVEVDLGRGEQATRWFGADGLAAGAGDRPATRIVLGPGQGPDAAALARAVAWLVAIDELPVAGQEVLPYYGRDADARPDAGRSLIDRT